jgi:putative transposase
MPRALRIEYEDAVYHVMARGDRREAIVHHDTDREVFVETLGEACARTGWRVLAWVLLDNHYHLALRTPEPNLVSGMSWFQNTFTRRINVRNQLWGHLFGGRYKAVVVEDTTDPTSKRRSVYLETLVDYIHLNPVRAGLVDGYDCDILSYPWSSIVTGYAKPPSQRPSWMAVRDGLDLFGERDEARGRRSFIERLDGIARAEGVERAGVAEVEGQTLQSTLRRGWYWGSETFREKLVEIAGGKIPMDRDRELRSSGLFQRHDEKGAERILAAAEEHFAVNLEELIIPRRGDYRRIALAWALSRRTSLPQVEIAEKLSLCSAANVSQRVRQFEALDERMLDSKVRRWKRKFKI